MATLRMRREGNEIRNLGGEADGGSVGSVGSTEGVVDVEVGLDGLVELVDELGGVLGLASVETDVLEEDDVAVLHGVDDLGDGLADDLIGLDDGLLEVLAQSGGDLGIDGGERGVRGRG